MVKEPKIANQSNNESETNEKNNLPNSNVWLRCFNEISGYSGVFICGPYPHWFFMSYRGELRAHEMNIDGPVLCFSTFNNINCPKGFLYAHLNIAYTNNQQKFQRFFQIRYCEFVLHNLC